MNLRTLFGVILAGMLLELPAIIIAADNPSGLTVHVVQRGESLYWIAREYGVTIDELAQLNGLTDQDSLEVGQRLLVPAPGAAANVPTVHIVQPGETLQGIADLYGTDVESLAAFNEIADVNTIYVGEVINIAGSPVPFPSGPVEPSGVVPDVVGGGTPSAIVYTVQSGETLFRIALSYGLTVNDLVQANGLEDPESIYAGQQILVPGVQPPQYAAVLPEPVTSLDIAPTILVEGRTGRIRVTAADAGAVTGTFLGHSLRFLTDENYTVFYALVSVPVFTSASVYPLMLTVNQPSGQSTVFTVNVRVISSNYDTQIVDLPEDKTSLLDPTTESNELSLLQGLTGIVSPERFFNGPMGLPTAAAMNAPFGTRRSYNGGAVDHYHTGADFAGLPGMPIMAAASGRVVLSDTFNIRGNITMIDHGWGVYTTYSHQTVSYVHVGDFVTAGQVIGTIGESGRVTGAHLHWELWVNGVPVDPMQWVVQSFS